MRLIIIAFFAGMLLAAMPAAQAARDYYYTPVQTGLQDLQQVSTGTVTEVVRPDMLRIDDARLVVIDNIRVPLIYADRAVEFLNAEVLNKKIRTYANTASGGTPLDRMGNAVVHVVLEDSGEWLQGKMVGQGLAWVDSTADQRDLVLPLLKIEDAARKSGLGFWAKPGMAVRTPENVLDIRNSFQIVEGKIVSTSEKRNVVFANFGDDWKTDFTISITADNYRQFPKGFYLRDMKGQTVRVRGWITDRNGPMMDVTHPEQMEIIEAPAEDEKDAAPADAETAQ